jgi:hypothetical protein
MAVKTPLTFERICELEPEVKELYLKAKNLKDKRKNYELWHRQLKPILTTLVGEHAKNPTLRSFEALEAATDKITHVLGL